MTDQDPNSPLHPMNTPRSSVNPLERWGAALAVLDEFRSWLRPDFPQLEIVALNDIRWVGKMLPRYNAQRDAFPELFGGRGVYLIFDKEEQLGYVGSTTVAFTKEIFKLKSWRRWSDVIKFPDECYYFAGALEILLIKRLKPPVNQIHATQKS